MEKSAVISIRSFSDLDKDEVIEVVTPGKFHLGESEFKAVYEESEISGMDGTTTTLVIKDDVLVLEREGSTSTRMEFKKGEDVKIRFVNRLDMNTSGLVIVAKNPYAQFVLSSDMKEDKVEKMYIAVVKGVVKEDRGTINAPIYRPTEDSVKRIVHVDGQPSITHYEVVERLNDATVLKLRLETGRTHQIRVHLNHIGHGIIGDELYGYVDENLINRQALHAYSLKFKQPRTKENLEFEAQLPKDMEELIKKLK